MSKTGLVFAGLGGLALFMFAKSANALNRNVLFTQTELIQYQQPDGTLLFTPSFKPIVNSDEFDFVNGFGMGNANDFDFGAWATEVEPWGPQSVYTASIPSDPNLIESMNNEQLIVEVANYLMNAEGFVGYVYDDVNGKPWSESKKGNPTIGYGHVVKSGEPLDWVMIESEAYELLLNDVASHLEPIIPYVKVPLTLPQWVAIASLAFNAGPGQVKKSKFIAAVNAGNLSEAESQFKDWNKATVTVDGVKIKRVVNGLTNRRAREWAMFAQSAPVVYLA